MNAYEQAKKNIARAEELAQAVKDGKRVEFRNRVFPVWGLSTASNSECQIFEAMSNGTEYRIIEPKRRRPWTSEEAERHVGWVLVGPNGVKQVILGLHHDQVFWMVGDLKPTFKDMCENGWKVYRTDKPEDLKPCWVEE